MTQQPSNPSLHDLAAALDNDGELPEAPIPNQASANWPPQVGEGGHEAFPLTGKLDAGQVPHSPLPGQPPGGTNTGWQMQVSGQPGGYENFGAPSTAPVSGGVHDHLSAEELPPAIRHLGDKLRRLESEHLPMLRQRAVPGCPGCQDYDDSYRGLLRHLIALEDATKAAVKTLKSARGRYAQAMREAFTEQADRYENLADQARSIESLSDAEQANLIPTFANELRAQTMGRAESLAESKRAELKSKLEVTKRDRDHLRQQLDVATSSVNQVTTSLRDDLGVSATMITKYLSGDIDLGNLLANVVGNAGGAVKLNSLHAAIWIGTEQPQGAVGKINAAPTTLNSALGGEDVRGKTVQAPEATEPEPPREAKTPPPSEPPTLRPTKKRSDEPVEQKRPPVVSQAATKSSKDAEQDMKIKVLLKILSRRGIVSAKSISTHTPITDSELKELVLTMNRSGAGISWLAAEGDALLAATATFMPYYENWFERFNEADEEHRGYLGWITTHKILDQGQVSAIAPVLSSLLGDGWLVGYPVRFQGVSGAKAPVGLHLVRTLGEDRGTQNALLLYVPNAKSTQLPKAVTTQSFDCTYLYTPNPTVKVLPENLKSGIVYGIKKAPGVGRDVSQWKNLTPDGATTP